MNGDYSLSDSTHDFISYIRFTTMSHLIWNIFLFSNYDAHFFFYRTTTSIRLNFHFCFLWKIINFSFSESFFNNRITKCFDDTHRFPREISKLHEYIFFLFCIECFPIHVFQYRKIFIQSFSIIFLQIRVQYTSPLFYKITPFFTINKLSDMFTGFWCFCNREPRRIRLSIFIRHYLDTFPIFQLIIQWYDLPIHFCNSQFIPDSTMDSISKIYWCRSFWKSNDISLGCEYKNLIRKYIHMHFFHKFSSIESMTDDFFNRLYPVTIFRVFRSSRF